MKGESKNKKEKWGKPKLIILTRGKPEERVLQGCKRTTVEAVAGNPNAVYADCWKEMPSPSICETCSILESS